MYPCGIALMAMIATIPGPQGVVQVGGAHPVRVMALIGSTSRRDQMSEEEKVDRLSGMTDAPDVIADLSLRLSAKPLWRRIVEAGMPAATLPIYTVERSDMRIDRSELLERALEQIEGGVGMITIHPTAAQDIINVARADRNVSWTSRGGGIVIRDLLSRGSTSNAYLDIIPDLIPAARRVGATISIGATFRSATILDANDRAQRLEFLAQIDLARQISANGCSVMIEGPGHAAPGAIRALAEQMLQAGCPIMPLGPIPTDLAIGQDHISAAIGATLLGLEGAAHMIAAVTREEHTGGVPDIEATIEAVQATRVAARVIDLHRHGPGEEDFRVVRERTKHGTCVAGRKTPGCSRCGTACPLESRPNGVR